MEMNKNFKKTKNGFKCNCGMIFKDEKECDKHLENLKNDFKNWKETKEEEK